MKLLRGQGRGDGESDATMGLLGESRSFLEWDLVGRGRRVTTPTKPTAVPPTSSVMTVGPSWKWVDLLPDPNSCEWTRGQRPRGLDPKGITLEA